MKHYAEKQDTRRRKRRGVAAKERRTRLRPAAEQSQIKITQKNAGLERGEAWQYERIDGRVTRQG